MRATKILLRSVLGLTLVALIGCGPPQIGADEGAFKAVDALYTAVSLRDKAQVERCSGRLDALHKDGRLPDAAHASLKTIMETARGGRWEEAGDSLREFMKGQRS